MDTKTNTLMRAGVPSIVNPYDEYALEAAALLKDEYDGTRIVALCMGPDQAEEALRSCVAAGSDAAYLVSDRSFAGSDTLATSYILAQAIRAIMLKEGSFDIIFCGKQAIDGDTAQVGPGIAEHLGYPQATNVVSVTWREGLLTVERESDYGRETLGISLPAVVTVTANRHEPRIPSLRDRMKANEAVIKRLNHADIGTSPDRIGLQGSPTKVKKVQIPTLRRDCVMLGTASDSRFSSTFVSLLRDLGMSSK
jgi:electron transfer flavoprotein beta subunit